MKKRRSAEKVTATEEEQNGDYIQSDDMITGKMAVNIIIEVFTGGSGL